MENCWKLADNSNEDGVSGEGLDDEAEGWGEELYEEAAKKNLTSSQE